MQTLPKNKPELVTVNIENQNNNNNNQPKNNGLKEWINQHITETIGGLVILSLILFGGSVGNTWTAYRGFRDSITKEFKIQELSGQIIHLDEVLTMSARMAASTGETRWEDRYNNFVEPLDKAIKETLTLVPEVTQQNTAQTDEANLKLVDMETKAFELVRAGKSQEALELLLGKEYEEQKTIYAQGINTTIDNIKTKVENDLEFYSSRLRNSVIFAGITLPVLIIGWAMVFWLIKSYISDRQKALNELSSSQKELLQLNEELEDTSQKIIEQEKITQVENELLQTDVGHLLDVVSAIEEGDLTINAEVNDRLTGLVSDTLNRLLEQLREVINQVINTTEKVNRGTTKLEDVALNTATRLTEQTELIKECQQLITQVTALSQETLKQELMANKALENAEIAVKQGEEQITTMTGKVGILQQETEQISTRVKNLTNFVELASKFSKDQKRVAALTRVLALNASMIANRASQQQDPEQFMSIAKEFETIANQVNNLAVETNENLIELQQRTDQIETVVSGLNQDTNNINEIVRDFILGIQESYQMFEQISKITNQIVEVEKEVMNSSQNITDLSANTLNSIENISKIGQNTEAEMKITLEQTNAMGTLAQNLLEITKFFRTN